MTKVIAIKERVKQALSSSDVGINMISIENIKAI